MGWPVILGALAAGYSAIKGGQNQGKANELNDQALQLALADYEDRKPLRDAFTQGALTPIAQAPDLSSVFAAARSDNPFATGGAPRSAHVPSQLPPMGRYGSGTAAGPGYPPTALPAGGTIDVGRTGKTSLDPGIDLGTKSPVIQHREAQRRSSQVDPTMKSPVIQNRVASTPPPVIPDSVLKQLAMRRRGN